MMEVLFLVFFTFSPMLRLSELVGQKQQQQQQHSYYLKKLAAVSPCLVLLQLTTILFLGTVPLTTGITSDILSFAPTVIGLPLHTTYTFTPEATIPASTWIEITLPGMTTGQIQGMKGSNIGSVVDLTTAILESSPPLLFEGAWYGEGDPSTEFVTSTLFLRTIASLATSVPVTVQLDALNGIKSNCGHPTDLTEFTWQVGDAALNYNGYGGAPFSISSVTSIDEECYVASSKLTLFPPRPGREVDVMVKFKPGRALDPGDTTLPQDYSSSTRANGWIGQKSIPFQYKVVVLAASLEIITKAAANVFVVLPPNYFSTLYDALWTEGTYVKDSPGYAGSQITLTVLSARPAGTDETVIFPRSNGIMAQCGMKANRADTRISVTAALWSSSQAFEISNAVGEGCSHMNNCNGHGYCDNCLERCVCDEGYGSELDMLYASGGMAKDCSEMACPRGAAYAPVFDPSLTQHHPLMECSNVGTCQQNIGVCDCPAWLHGRACERSKCINGCSGHGQCLSMRRLAEFEIATPISPATTYDATAFDDDIAWDMDSIFGCLCDSTWAVGLEAGKTQSSEWFGADCSLRRCPSGDDPETAQDETDATGIACPGSASVAIGEAANLCHLDCSGRGICNHDNGVCSCFNGYTSVSCGIRTGLQ